MDKKSIVLTGGGTAGHVMPNLALLPKLKEKFDNIYYIGEKGGVEERLAKEAGLDFYGITCVKFDRSRLLQNYKIPSLLRKGVVESQRLLKMLSPSVVFAKGGYVSLPVTISAKRAGVPYVLHESDITLGLANKLVKNKAELVFTSFEGTVKGELVSGNPVRREIFLGEASKAPIFSENKNKLLFVGGSSGATAINNFVVKVLPYLNDYNVIHLCGKNKSEQLKGIRSSSYLPLEYSSHIADLYAWADVVVTRAGANALSELLALGKKVIAIPLPKGGSRGDQSLNAEYYRLKGLIDVLPQDALTVENFMATLNSCMNKPKIKPLNNNAVDMISDELYKIASRQK